MATIQKEIRQRSIIGKIIKWIFIAFNILMLLWLGSVIFLTGDIISSSSDAAFQAGAVFGGAFAMGIILNVWVIGDIILGILTLLTRGTKYIITEEITEEQ
ncbi:hypothetical protein [Bartonella sp. DGB1]|uniref:hypothetical protein n=1 Tax=Bartonella sp. DGB1 TaxID=3239807 RepID=UPI0035256C95